MLYTGSHQNCNDENFKLVAISGNRGKDAGFVGDAYPALAPKLGFWRVWHENIGKISDEDNNRYYIEEYYKQVLSKLNPQDVYHDLTGSILLCYEEPELFCHRHIVAAWLEITLGVQIPEVKIQNHQLVHLDRPKYIKTILEEVMRKENHLTLRYYVDTKNGLEVLPDMMKKNGFSLKEKHDSSHMDIYYDTDDYRFYQSNRVFKICFDEKSVTGSYEEIKNDGNFFDKTCEETTNYSQLTSDMLRDYLESLGYALPNHFYKILRNQVEESEFVFSNGFEEVVFRVSKNYYVGVNTARYGHDFILEFVGKRDTLKNLEHDLSQQGFKSSIESKYHRGIKKTNVDIMKRVRLI